MQNYFSYALNMYSFIRMQNFKQIAASKVGLSNFEGQNMFQNCFPFNSSPHNLIEPHREALLIFIICKHYFYSILFFAVE